jgi:hypothetical protein
MTDGAHGVKAMGYYPNNHTEFASLFQDIKKLWDRGTDTRKYHFVMVIYHIQKHLGKSIWLIIPFNPTSQIGFENSISNVSKYN